jgi:hypothetical protein
LPQVFGIPRKTHPVGGLARMWSNSATQHTITLSTVLSGVCPAKDGGERQFAATMSAILSAVRPLRRRKRSEGGSYPVKPRQSVFLSLSSGHGSSLHRYILWSTRPNAQPIVLFCLRPPPIPPSHPQFPSNPACRAEANRRRVNPRQTDQSHPTDPTDPTDSGNSTQFHLFPLISTSSSPGVANCEWRIGELGDWD